MSNRLLKRKSKLVLMLAMLSLAAAPASALPMYLQTLGPAELGHVDTDTPLDYSHAFDVQGATIVSAMLAVLTVDQPACLLSMPGAACDLLDLASIPETADIDVAGSDFASGAASLGLFVGDVTSALIAGGGVLDVGVTSTDGDFYAWRSLLLVAYEPGGGSGSGNGAGPSVPEPGAATLFGLGSLLIARASRRQR